MTIFVKDGLPVLLQVLASIHQYEVQERESVICCWNSKKIAITQHESAWAEEENSLGPKIGTSAMWHQQTIYIYMVVTETLPLSDETVFASYGALE